jgi:hypothetical protein
MAKQHADGSDHTDGLLCLARLVLLTSRVGLGTRLDVAGRGTRHDCGVFALFHLEVVSGLTAVINIRLAAPFANHHFVKSRELVRLSNPALELQLDVPAEAAPARSAIPYV